MNRFFKSYLTANFNSLTTTRDSLMTIEFDLTLRGGLVHTGDGTHRLDIGIRGEQIVALAPDLCPGRQDFDVGGKLILPGGIDSHCHIEQMSGMGIMGADDFYSGTVSAAFGGTTTVIPFAMQRRGESLLAAIDDYAARATPKAVIDYAFHAILTDASDDVLTREVPIAVSRGITSFKVYMTYDAVRLNDTQILDVFASANQHGALVMVHAESNDMVRWLTARLLERGLTAPKYHEVAHDPLAETEATYRAVSLARLAGAPLLIVHVGGIEAVQVIHAAQTMGAPVYAETCPQYLVLSREDLDLPGLEGAKFCCAPPPRDGVSREAVWAGLASGTLSVFSSDHAPYRFDSSGKLPNGAETRFSEIANGVPGLETRLPLLFSEGVGKGRISLERYVALTAANPAKAYGLYPRKGVIRVGSDADLVIWDTDRHVTITSEMLHDRVGYTPYEGMQVQGWPETTICRGKVVVNGGQLLAKPGDGTFLACGPSEWLVQPERPVPDGLGRDGRGLLFRKLFDL